MIYELESYTRNETNIQTVKFSALSMVHSPDCSISSAREEPTARTSDSLKSVAFGEIVVPNKLARMEINNQVTENSRNRQTDDWPSSGMKPSINGTLFTALGPRAIWFTAESRAYTPSMTVFQDPAKLVMLRRTSAGRACKHLRRSVPVLLHSWEKKGSRKWTK